MCINERDTGREEEQGAGQRREQAAETGRGSAQTQDEAGNRAKQCGVDQAPIMRPVVDRRHLTKARGGRRKEEEEKGSRVGKRRERERGRQEEWGQAGRHSERRVKW